MKLKIQKFKKSSKAHSKNQSIPSETQHRSRKDKASILQDKCKKAQEQHNQIWDQPKKIPRKITISPFAYKI